MIKSAELENRQDRGPRAEDLREALKKRARKLAERLAAARALKPPKELGRAHCGCCYGRGRDDAIRIIEEAGPED